MNKRILLGTLIPIIVLGIGFIILTILLVANNLAPFGIDTAIANGAYEIRGEKGNATYWFFRVITECGYTYFIIGLVLLMAIIWKFRGKTWFFAGTIIFAWIIQEILKRIIMRPRPDATFWWMTETSSSYPSGHSMMVACVFILLMYFIITSPTVKVWAKYLISTLSISAIILVPISRIILGVHYFTDVIGGLMIGALIALIGILIYNIYLDKSKKKQPKQIQPQTT